MATPALIVFGLTVAIGLYMGLRFLKGERNSPMLIGTHFLLGAGGMEVLVLAIHGTPMTPPIPLGTYGQPVIILFVMALISGVAAQLVFKNSVSAGTIALGAHALIAATGFGLLVTWLVWR
jgi:hypothetical protein